MAVIIRGRHAERASSLYRQKLAASSIGLIICDDFLEPVTLAELQRPRTDYRTVACLRPDDGGLGRGRHVSLDAWERADPADRYFRFDATPTWTVRDAASVIEDGCPLTARQLFEMLVFARAVSGEHLEATRLEFHAMGDGDFIAAHQDARLGRRFAAHVYLTDSGGNGGALRINDSDGQVTEVLPAPNRLVFFDVERHRWHDVTPCEGKQARRESANFWFF